jgi:hypothetical protein
MSLASCFRFVLRISYVPARLSKGGWDTHIPQSHLQTRSHTTRIAADQFSLHSLTYKLLIMHHRTVCRWSHSFSSTGTLSHIRWKER